MDYGLSWGWEEKKGKISKSLFLWFFVRIIFSTTYKSTQRLNIERSVLDLSRCSTIHYNKKMTNYQNFFAGSSTRIQIDRLLGKLTPKCLVCNGEKEYICIEKNCMKKEPYVCITCD